MIELGLLLGILIAPLPMWLFGMFNPIGYLGVPPWRVPKCTCGQAAIGSYRHDSTCLRR